MTRQELEADYRVDEYGLIASPGKFEREPLYVPYFWNLALEGGADDETDMNDVPTSVFKLTDEDRALWPELADCTTLRVWSDDNGFVYCDVA